MLNENSVFFLVRPVVRAALHGVERPVTFAGRIRLRQGTLWVRGESFIKPREFGVPLLRHWLLSIKESVLTTFDLVLSKAQ
jgi:hypothetical protein